MGFLDGLGRILQGKPVFDETALRDEAGWKDENDYPVGDLEQTPAVPEQPSNKTPVDENGYKIIPVVSLEHCKSHINGDTLEVTMWATNTSTNEIELETMVIAGVTTHLDQRRLAPGQGHEVCVYKGPIPKREDHQAASLYYRMVKSDDNFRADFIVEYNYQSDGTYLIEQLHPENSVHDI